MPYNHQDVEKKWQERWQQAGVFHAKDNSIKPKFYCLIEFPYPSGAGLHIGHPRSYTALDVVARKRRMEGYNVLYPIGWDAFGLPTENYAIKTGRPPQEVTNENVATFKRQLQSLGFSFDWSREVNTTDPSYYKWTQWMFLEFFKAGLAYKARMPINWCLSCKIGLANEEVVDGKCERCGGPTEKRHKEQWMIAITKYADRLLEDLESVNYLEKIKTQQRNWIGRSEGVQINFSLMVPGQPDGKHHVTVFTTRPDTLFGATFLVVSPEKAQEWIQVGWKASDEVQVYVSAALKRSEIDRGAEDREKTGVDTGVRAINPANQEEIPVWVADYVLGGYGTGAIMAVPAHDERDFAFATAFHLPVRQVIRLANAPVRSYVMGADGISPADFENIGVTIARKTADGDYEVEIPRGREKEFERLMSEKMAPGFWNEYVGDETVFLFKHTDGHIERLVMNAQTMARIDELACEFNHLPYDPKDPGNYINGALARNTWYQPLIVHTQPGVLMNSGEFDGMENEQAKSAIPKKVGGEKKVQYKLRDWVFSRQRYWGEPIPLVFCQTCGWVAVPVEHLPVVLPIVEKYEPTDTGESPLAAMADWVNTSCPTCGSPAKRETDTMPNWAGSSWYFLRYIDPHNDTAFAAPEKLKYWMPVDWYNGGMEHTTLHLLYSRFWNKFLFDRGHVPVSEPYAKRTSHGLILAEDGTKMSKSKGNVVNPDEMVEQYGADAVRLYELFMGPFAEPVPWSLNGLVGMRRFLEKVIDAGQKIVDAEDAEVTRLLHQTIKKVSEDVEAMRFNTAVSQMMIFINGVKQMGGIRSTSFFLFLRVLCPFAPHLSNELHESFGGKELLETLPWPMFDPKIAQAEVVSIGVQINGKMRATIDVAPDAPQEQVQARALREPNVQKHLEGQTIRKTVYVAGRIINLIV
ncbi:leucine--tRNA ligase [Candidatus Uhrbacteria bacterium]|nr:leucine--tRNA ligase [Candidatus Uhrbacteria bacterium]